MKKLILPVIIVASLIITTCVSIAVYKYTGMTKEQKVSLHDKLKIETPQKLKDFEELDAKSVKTLNEDDIKKAQKAGEDFKKTANELSVISTEIGAFDYDVAIKSLIDTSMIEMEENLTENTPQWEHRKNVRKICEKYLRLQKEKKISSKELYQNLEKELMDEQTLLLENSKSKRQ